MRFLTTIFLVLVSLAALASAGGDKKNGGQMSFEDVVKTCVYECKEGPHCRHYCECMVYKMIGKSVKCTTDSMWDS